MILKQKITSILTKCHLQGLVSKGFSLSLACLSICLFISSTTSKKPGFRSHCLKFPAPIDLLTVIQDGYFCPWTDLTLNARGYRGGHDHDRGPSCGSKRLKLEMLQTSENMSKDCCKHWISTWFYNVYIYIRVCPICDWWKMPFMNCQHQISVSHQFTNMIIYQI